MATKLVKNSYVKDVLQKHSRASQVGGDALDRIDELFQEFLIKVASAAAESLKADERTKVAAEDIEFGYQHVLGQSEVPLEPVRYIEALQAIPFEKLGEVLRLLVEWNNAEDAKWSGANKK